MRLNDSGLFAFGGSSLAEGELVRLIYADEAGTGPAEPVRIVASVIVDGDNQWRSLEAEISRVIREGVPELYRSGFNFHGKELFNRANRYFDPAIWSFDDRLDFFKEFLCLPFVNDVPIALGVVFKGSFDHTELFSVPKASKHKIRMHQLEHMIAFQYCMERSDQFLRKYLNGSEIGTIVAEDTQEMRKLLSESALAHRDAPFYMPSEGLRPEAWQAELGLTPDPLTYQIQHIIDVPHFVNKGKAPFLQLADACAFAFRRCLSRQEHGEDLVLAMLGPRAGRNFVSDPVWYSHSSSGLFNTVAYWSPEQKAQHQATTLALMTKRISSV